MSGALDKWIDQVVNVITSDGRNIIGLFRGFDQSINLILEHSHERIYSPDAPMEQIDRGLCLIRGDNVAVIGELDEDKDLAVDINAVRGDYLRPVVH